MKTRTTVNWSVLRDTVRSIPGYWCLAITTKFKGTVNTRLFEIRNGFLLGPGFEPRWQKTVDGYEIWVRYQGDKAVSYEPEIDGRDWDNEDTEEIFDGPDPDLESKELVIEYKVPFYNTKTPIFETTKRSLLPFWADRENPIE